MGQKINPLVFRLGYLKYSYNTLNLYTLDNSYSYSIFQDLLIAKYIRKTFFSLNISTLNMHPYMLYIKNFKIYLRYFFLQYKKSENYRIFLNKARVFSLYLYIITKYSKFLHLNNQSIQPTVITTILYRINNILLFIFSLHKNFSFSKELLSFTIFKKMLSGLLKNMPSYQNKRSFLRPLTFSKSNILISNIYIYRTLLYYNLFITYSANFYKVKPNIKVSYITQKSINVFKISYIKLLLFIKLQNKNFIKLKYQMLSYFLLNYFFTYRKLILCSYCINTFYNRNNKNIFIFYNSKNIKSLLYNSKLNFFIRRRSIHYNLQNKIFFKRITYDLLRDLLLLKKFKIFIKQAIQRHSRIQLAYIRNRPAIHKLGNVLTNSAYYLYYPKRIKESYNMLLLRYNNIKNKLYKKKKFQSHSLTLGQNASDLDIFNSPFVSLFKTQFLFFLKYQIEQLILIPANIFFFNLKSSLVRLDVLNLINLILKYKFAAKFDFYLPYSNLLENVVIGLQTYNIQLLGFIIARQLSKIRKHKRFLRFIIQLILLCINSYILGKDLQGFYISLSGRFNNSSRKKFFKYKWGVLEFTTADTQLEYYKKSIITHLGILGFSLYFSIKPTKYKKNNENKI
jgi:hypothetical protein